MGIHDGHRRRLKERFLQNGLEGFNDLNALELLLFYAQPQRDMNPLAHALLERFGTLSGVLDASKAELEKVAGMGENTATLLLLAAELSRRYLIDRGGDEWIFHDSSEAGNYLLPYFFRQRRERVYLLCLDQKNKLLCLRMLGEGTIGSANMDVRRVVEAAMAVSSEKVILAHNHPSGIALPSVDDIQTTKAVAAALKTVGIQLVDHIIVADGDFVSLADSGQYSAIF